MNFREFEKRVKAIDDVSSLTSDTFNAHSTRSTHIHRRRHHYPLCVQWFLTFLCIAFRSSKRNVSFLQSFGTFSMAKFPGSSNWLIVIQSISVACRLLDKSI